jgi:hypothetical protein
VRAGVEARSIVLEKWLRSRQQREARSRRDRGRLCSAEEGGEGGRRSVGDLRWHPAVWPAREGWKERWFPLLDTERGGLPWGRRGGRDGSGSSG